MPALYQAEWCPYSSAARQLLTERGIDFVARQVEPNPDERTAMRERTGTDEIPVLETDDGRLLRGNDEIAEWVRSLPPSPHAPSHRRLWAAHHPQPLVRRLVEAVPAE